jgi:hypothetical protein
MNLMIIQELPVALGDFEKPTTQTANDSIRSQDVIAPDSILVGGKLDPDHDWPRLPEYDSSVGSASRNEAAGAAIGCARERLGQRDYSWPALDGQV